MTRVFLLNAAAAAVALAAAPGIAAAATPPPPSAIAIRPLSIRKTADLDFGDLVASASTGTVTIDAAIDARSVGGGVIGAAGSMSSAARFTAIGLVNTLAVISLPPSIVPTRGGGTETVTVSNVTTNGATKRPLPASATLDMRVGGQLNVGANQVVGNYARTFTVTVLYF